MVSDVSIVQNGSFVSLWNSSFNKVITDDYFEKSILLSDDGVSVDICYTQNMTGVGTFKTSSTKCY